MPFDTYLLKNKKPAFQRAWHAWSDFQVGGWSGFNNAFRVATIAACLFLGADGAAFCADSPGVRPALVWRKVVLYPAYNLCITISPDGKLLAWGGGGFHVLQARTGVPISGGYWVAPGSGGYGGGPTSLDFSPDSKLLAVGCSQTGGLRVYVARTGVLRWKTQAHGPEGVSSVQFSPDGKRVASGGLDGWVRVWDAPSGKLVAKLPGREAMVGQVLYAPNGKTLFAVCKAEVPGFWWNDLYIRMWDTASWKEKPPLHVRKSLQDLVMAISEDGSVLATAFAYDVSLWKMGAQAPFKTLRSHARIHEITFGKGRLLLGRDDGFVDLWDITKGRVVATLDVPRHATAFERGALLKSVLGIAFNNKTQMLAAVDVDTTLAVWRLVPPVK